MNKQSETYPEIEYDKKTTRCHVCNFLIPVNKYNKDLTMSKYKVTIELEFDEMPTHNDVKEYVSNLLREETLQFETICRWKNAAGETLGVSINNV